MYQIGTVNIKTQLFLRYRFLISGLGHYLCSIEMYHRTPASKNLTFLATIRIVSGFVLFEKNLATVLCK